MFRGKSATNGEGQTGGVPFNRLGVAAEEQNGRKESEHDEGSGRERTGRGDLE